MRISDWSSDVCSSDLLGRGGHRGGLAEVGGFHDRHIGRHRAGENAPDSTPVSRHDRRGGWTRSFPPNGSKPNWARPICASSMPLISFPPIIATPSPSSRPRTSPARRSPILRRPPPPTARLPPPRPPPRAFPERTRL